MAEKSTKKVLYFITKSVWGGAQKYVHDLATNLPRDKFNAVVASGGHGVMAEKLKNAGVEYLPIKSFQRDINIFKDFLAFFEILFILIKTKPNIVHVSSSKAGGVVGASLFIYKFLTFRFSLFALFTVHGWAFLEQRPEWQNWFIKLFSKLTCLSYDKIICVSQNDYNEAIKNKIAPARKMVVIHNGVSPSDYNFLSPTSKEFCVGTIGESTKNKGHKYLIEAEKYFPGVKFKIISNVPDAANYLKNFDIFVLPSLKEGLPYTILEAGLAKLPVMASNVGGIPEIIENEKSGLLVPPANPEELAKAIKKLIDNTNLRAKLATNLHQKITQEFTLSKMLTATVAAYEE